MSSPFEKVSPQVEFSTEEHQILALWAELDAFAESNRRRSGAEPFVFYDGPPFATGTPHYGHLLASTIKDIVPRYWNMRGHPVERRFGWDCHGLPIEALAQDALGLSGTAQIVEKGVDTFNEQCRSMVQTYVAEWRKTITRLGRWVDFDHDYKTMDPSFMESVWWVFKQLWDQGRIYKSYRIMPYSWKLTTPLSNFEANSNYKDVQDPAITVRFRLQTLASPSAAATHENVADHSELQQLCASGQLYVLAWTTTPWTLPANLALCTGPDIDYIAVRLEGESATYILAEARVGAVFNKKKFDVVARFKGTFLEHAQYSPLFNFFEGRANCFQILTGQFVTTNDGTGIVHLAPAYGEDDFNVCKSADIELVDPLDAEANFTDLVPPYMGKFCKDADRDIIQDLKKDGRLLRQDTVVHSYPFDDRTDTPLIYRAIEAWYVRVEEIRDDLVEQNDTVGWVPAAIGKNRFGNWLKDARDWNISRNRFWGSCIPIWINEADPEDTICVGSIEELEELSGVRVTDLHKHFIDPILIKKDGKTYRRTPEVLDCWFESGSMPFAQKHYPFEDGDNRTEPGNDARFQGFFPANFIAEGLDQTRGWFYTLLILGTALFKKSPYKNVIVNGMILAEDGQKMSKRKKNYPDPTATLETYGADALRAYMINSPVVRGEPLKFSERGLKEIVRTVVLPYWNALSFFTTYASVDGYDPADPAWKAPEQQQRPAIDRWALSVLQSLIRDVNVEMEGYRLYSVVPRLVTFIDDLTNWYIRRSRPRFWKSSDRQDQAAAYATLHELLTTFAQVLAPFMPFVTEMVHQRLVVTTDSNAPRSVHFCDYPTPDEAAIDTALEERMAIAREAVVLCRKLREDHKLKIRQPLSMLTVVHRSAEVRKQVLDISSIIAEEVNVKTISVEADESLFTSIVVKPNFKTLGKRCGKKLGPIKKALAGWQAVDVAKLEAGASIDVEGEPISLGDVILERSSKGDAAVATNGHISVVLDTGLTDALVSEGQAREFISQVQAARKAAELQVSDRILLRWATENQGISQALINHGETIKGEVLALAFDQVPLEVSTSGTEPDKAFLKLTINEEELFVQLTKA